MSDYGQFHSQILTLSLSGNGQSQEEALNQILAQMRKQVMEDLKGVVLYMAPAKVQITGRRVNTWTERFLGLLWPRVRHRVELQAQLDVEVRWLRFTSAIEEVKANPPAGSS